MRHVVAVLLLASLGVASEKPPQAPYCRENSSCEINPLTPENNYYDFKVHGIKVIVSYHAPVSFFLTCKGNLFVDDSDLPAMNQLHEVKFVRICGCSAPLNASYAKALKAMNVSVNTALSLHNLPATPTLDHHLIGLPITNLEISNESLDPPQRPTQNYLKGVRLRSLKLHNVVPEPEALMRFPDTLEDLELVRTSLPTAESKLGNGSAWLERLSSLRTLSITENGLTETLTVPNLESLPNLTILHLEYIPLDSGNLLGKLKGSSIKNLMMRSCKLNHLPKNLFEGANLTTLDLSLNNLTVQEGAFSPLKWLTTLDLTESQVHSADLMNIVSSLPSLEILEASNNPLGSLCGDADVFWKLPWPKSLRSLNLSKTNITRISPDWIRNDALLDVNLSDNDIRYLNYQDMKMKRAALDPTAEMTIDLTNNPNLRIINVSSVDIMECHNDFTSSVDSNKQTQAKIKLILNSLSDAQCDYDAYMLHEVERNCPWLQFDKGFFNNLLSPSKPDEIVCPYSGDCLPDTKCSCKKRPRDNATVVWCSGTLPLSPRWPLTAPQYPLALNVANGTLDHVPRLVLVELHARNNNITNLNEEDLPDTLLELDVRYNKISHISEAVARKLNAIGTNRSVYLEGNRLACTCSDASALELLKHVVRDLNKTECADGIEVLQKIENLNEMCVFPVVPILWTLLSIVLVLLIVWLLLHRYKAQIRQVLFKLNWGRRFIFSVKDNDAEKTVDVFLSYAHRDLEVLKKLKNGIEARGYTTLEHNRDWQPGVPIIDQIALSVKCARRTLLLVSDNYADSQWAVEEFRAAHAHAMKRQTTRVLVVRLQDNLHQPERLPLNLQLYLKYNTYLDWADVNFWEKLCKAMPMHFQISN